MHSRRCVPNSVAGPQWTPLEPLPSTFCTRVLAAEETYHGLRCSSIHLLSFARCCLRWGSLATLRQRNGDVIHPSPRRYGTALHLPIPVQASGCSAFMYTKSVGDVTQPGGGMRPAAGSTTCAVSRIHPKRCAALHSCGMYAHRECTHAHCPSFWPSSPTTMLWDCSLSPRWAPIGRTAVHAPRRVDVDLTSRGRLLLLLGTVRLDLCMFLLRLSGESRMVLLYQAAVRFLVVSLFTSIQTVFDAFHQDHIIRCYKAFVQLHCD